MFNLVIKAEEDELSDEDKQLKEELELCVTRLGFFKSSFIHSPYMTGCELSGEAKKELWSNALTTMTTLIRASTTSMTSVPKPLKFMIPHFDTMKACHGKMEEEGAVKRQCADVVSVLAMTMSEERECLKYKLLGNQTTEEIELWGHEYVRHLAGEVVQEFNGATEEDDLRKTLVTMAKLIVPSQMKHHAEAEACDLLMEVEQLDDLQQYVDDSAYSRVCLYLVSCVPYVPEPENTNLLKTALSIFRKFNQFPQVSRYRLNAFFG